MSLFQDESRFAPERDGKVPLKRTPFILALRLVAHLSRMLFSRHPGDALRWGWSMLRRRRPLSYALPWLTFDAIRALDEKLRPGDRVFEFGSGHSTLYWARRGVEIASVEDDAFWFERLGRELRAFPNASLSLETEEPGYVGRLERTPGLFDAILVDGSHRKQCLIASLHKLKPGGYLIVDNTDWHWMQDFGSLVPATWSRQVHAGCAPFIGHTSETTIWRKP